MRLYNEDDEDEDEEEEESEEYPADPDYPPDSEQEYAWLVFPHIPF